MTKEKEKRKKRRLVAPTGPEERLLLELANMREERKKRRLVAPTGPEEGLRLELVKRREKKRRHLVAPGLEERVFVVPEMGSPSAKKKKKLPPVAPLELDGVLLVVPGTEIQKNKALLPAPEWDGELPVAP
jgi:hypothetical protein